MWHYKGMDLAALITAICASFSVNQGACVASGRGLAVQSGVQANAEALTQYGSNEGYRYFRTYITPITGEGVWVTGAGAYRVFRDKHIAYGFRAPLVDSIHLDASQGGGSVNVGWRF